MMALRSQWQQERRAPEYRGGAAKSHQQAPHSSGSAPHAEQLREPDSGKQPVGDAEREPDAQAGTAETAADIVQDRKQQNPGRRAGGGANANSRIEAVGGAGRRAASSAQAQRASMAPRDLPSRMPAADEASMRAEEILMHAVKGGNAARSTSSSGSTCGARSPSPIACSASVRTPRMSSRTAFWRRCSSSTRSTAAGRSVHGCCASSPTARSTRGRHAPFVRPSRFRPVCPAAMIHLRRHAAERDARRTATCARPVARAAALGRRAVRDRWFFRSRDCRDAGHADGTVRWHLHQARQTLREMLGHFAVRTS